MEIVIFQFIVLIFSVVIHEVSHGAVADKLGDPTARLGGRLTLNPISHLDPFGSLLLPLLLALSGFPVIGWAKPVPYNPYNLKNPKTGAAIIAASGPLSNFLLAIVFALGIRGVSIAHVAALEPLVPLFGIIVYINILLGVFNLVPIPPLDGSKVLFALLPAKNWALGLTRFLETYGLILIVFFIFFGFEVIVPLISYLFFILTGYRFG